MYTHRFYRDWVESDLAGFQVKVGETDVFILADRDLTSEAKKSIAKYKTKIAGERIIEKELEEIKSDIPQIYPKVMEFYERIKHGERDIYF